jgi:multicomponent Na+:H+ antiporter subunit D
VDVDIAATSLNKLGGLAMATPVLGDLFFVPAMNIAGIPPLSGFSARSGCWRPAPRRAASCRTSSSAAR